MIKTYQNRSHTAEAGYSVELFWSVYWNISFAARDKSVCRPSKAGAHIFLALATFSSFPSRFLSPINQTYATFSNTDHRAHINEQISHRKSNKNATFYSQKNTGHKTPSLLSRNHRLCNSRLAGFRRANSSCVSNVDQSRSVLRMDASLQHNVTTDVQQSYSPHSNDSKSHGLKKS